MDSEPRNSPLVENLSWRENMRKYGILFLIVFLACFFSTAHAEEIEKSSEKLLKEYIEKFREDIPKKEYCMLGTKNKFDRFKLLARRYQEDNDLEKKIILKKEIAYIVANVEQNHAILERGGRISKMSLCEGWSFGAESSNGKAMIHLFDPEERVSRFYFSLK